MVAATARRTRRVLVVDDEPDMRDLLSMFCRMGDVDVVGTAGTGAQAVEQWQEARTEGRPLDALVLDQMMPGMTGLEAADMIRAEDADVLLVLISAAMSSTLAEQCRQRGIDHALSKDRMRDLPDLLTG